MNQLEKQSISKLLVTYSIPAILGLVINAAYTMIDRVFIGNLPNHHGSLALSGIGVSMPITTFIIAISACIATGSLASISTELGRGDSKKAQQVLGNALSISIVTVVILTFLFYLFKMPIFQLLGANKEILVYTDRFLSILHGLKLHGALLPLMAVTTLLPGYLSLVGYPKVAVSINIFKQLIMYGLAISIFPLFLGKDGIWLAQPATEFVTLLISIYFAKRYLFQVIQEKTQEEGF